MSAVSIGLGTTQPPSSWEAMSEEDSAGSRDSQPFETLPPCQSCTPASAPCSCASSVMSRRLRTSWSSKSWAQTKPATSAWGLIEQYSVQTAAQPPSAFVPRCPACVPGFTVPKPQQCGTWKKRLRSVLGPMRTGSKRMS